MLAALQVPVVASNQCRRSLRHVGVTVYIIYRLILNGSFIRCTTSKRSLSDTMPYPIQRHNTYTHAHATAYTSVLLCAHVSTQELSGYSNGLQQRLTIFCF